MSLRGARMIRSGAAPFPASLAGALSKRCISTAVPALPKRVPSASLTAAVAKTLASPAAASCLSAALRLAPLARFSSVSKTPLAGTPLTSRPAVTLSAAAAAAAALAPAPVRAFSSSSNREDPKQELSDAFKTVIRALRNRAGEFADEASERIQAKWATMTVSDRVIAIAIGAVPVLYLAGKMFKFIIIGFLLWRFFPGVRRNIAQALLVRGNRDAAWLLSPNPRLPLYQPGLTPKEMREAVDEFTDNNGSMSGESFEGADMLRRELHRAREGMAKLYDQRFHMAIRERLEPETPTVKEYVPVDDPFFEDYFAPGARIQWGSMSYQLTDPSGRTDSDLPAPFNAAPGSAANVSLAFPVVDSLGRDDLGHVIVRCRVGPSRFVTDERDRLRSIYERMSHDPEVMFPNARSKWTALFEQDIALMTVTPVAAIYTSPWREPVAVQGSRVFMQMFKPPGKPIGTGPRVHAKPTVTDAEIVDLDEENDKRRR